MRDERQVFVAAPAAQHQLQALEHAAVTEPGHSEVARVVAVNQPQPASGLLQSLARLRNALLGQQGPLGVVDRSADRVQLGAQVDALEQLGEDRVAVARVRQLSAR